MHSEQAKPRYKNFLSEESSAEKHLTFDFFNGDNNGVVTYTSQQSSKLVKEKDATLAGIWEKRQQNK